MSIDRVIKVASWTGGEPEPVGEGFNWIYKGNNYSILYTRAGMYRGNHIHPNTQYTLLLNGKGKYIFEENGEEVPYPIKSGETLEIPAGVPHILLTEEDCLTVEWWDGPYESDEKPAFLHYAEEMEKRVEEYEKNVKK
jgi:mannose-6-phosphate isomerase-like protein (cupin superfamily)